MQERETKKSFMRSRLFWWAALPLCLVAGFLLGRYYQLPWDQPTGALDYTQLDEVYSVLKSNYDGVLDNSLLLEGAKRGMVDAAGDDYTQYFSYDEARQFQNGLDGRFEGIGAELGNRDGRLIVIATLDDSPAEKAGLKSGDIIAKVDDTATIDWQPEPAVQIIRGDRGTTVKLTIIRGSNTLEVAIVRDKITNPSASFEVRDGIGYLRITRFASDTDSLARRAAQQFVEQKVRGVVLDLRGNPGGYVDGARAVASLWLKNDTVIVVEKRGELVIDTEKSSATNPPLANTPTVVLIDGGSASASEIVAGALQDHGKARLVGTQSYGKGSVQVIKELLRGDQIKITTAKWYTPNGNNIDQTGIKPDVEVQFDDAAYAKNSTDNQYNEAVRLLK